MPNQSNRLSFIDFCSGIGGGRLGLEQAGMHCLAHSEINRDSEKTYHLFFNDKNNLGDVSKIEASDLPSFDLMLAGFPCQTFSIVGKRAGFEDERGQIIYYLVDILRAKNVPYFILENVKGLLNHQRGETLRSILSLLDQAGYDVSYQVLDSQFYGVPQMRERIYFIGIRKDIPHDLYQFPEKESPVDIREYLVDDRDYTFDRNNTTFINYLNNKYNQGKFNLDAVLERDHQVIDWRQSDCRFYYGKVPTLRTGRHGILYTKGGVLRKLSGFESLLLQGFPKLLAQKVVDLKLSDTQILSQAGNAMTVTVIQRLAEQLLKCLK